MNSTANNVNFNGIKLYYISRNSKTGKYLREAAKQPEVAKDIKSLEKQGMIFDFVRDFDFMGKKTDKVSFNLGRKPSYFTDDGKIPLYTVAKVTNADEAKAFVTSIVQKAKDFLPEHLKKVEWFNKNCK